MNNPAKNRLGLIQQQLLRAFTEIACARFKWIGLPDSVDERFMEMTVFLRGLSVFYWDETFERYMALRAASTGKINMYDNPTSFTVTGNTMVNKTLAANDCVPIWGNRLRVPDYDIAYLYSTRIAELERTIEINALSMRHPFIVAVDDNQKQSMYNAFRQVQEGQPVIFGTQGLQDLMESIKVFDIRPEKDSILNLQTLRSKQWNDCMTFLGVNNSNQEKRERLVESEVTANESQVNMMRNSALDMRKFAVEQINRMYGLSISVEWNVDVATLAKEMALSVEGLQP
jgi:hypothetical protein